MQPPIRYILRFVPSNIFSLLNGNEKKNNRDFDHSIRFNRVRDIVIDNRKFSRMDVFDFMDFSTIWFLPSMDDQRRIVSL